MNEIEDAGYILYPHPKKTCISIRVLRDGKDHAEHPDDTRILAQIWDTGDGLGWRVKA